MNIPNQVALREAQPVNSLTILESAVRGGIDKTNVEVVERLVALRRDEMREQAKSEFARAFFQLRKEISGMDFYADKSAKNARGEVAYTYCSEAELSERLDPVLMRHGFAMMFGQRQEDGRVVAIITLMHEGGHQEDRELSVRTGATNAMKDATAADAGATTTAWRHLVIKLFGLKSRIRAEDDARVEGEYITAEQADELERRVALTNSNRDKFLGVAGAKNFTEIRAAKYQVLDQLLAKKENRA